MEWNYIELEVKGQISGISASTSENSYGERHPIKHLEVMVKQTNEKPRLGSLNHRYDQLPILRTYKAELVDLDGGEKGVKIYSETFKDPSSMKGLGISSDGSPAQKIVKENL